jgi:hypothetical protein
MRSGIMNDETYNGWRNIETWRLQLHLTNDEQTAAAVARAIRSCSPLEDPPFSCSKVLRAYVEAHVLPDVTEPTDTWGQFVGDTVQAALGRVDWEQLAGYWVPMGWVDILEDELGATS